MKTEAHVSTDGWLNITITPETVEEAAALAHHNLNANADAKRVSSTHVYHRRVNIPGGTTPASMSTYITLRTKFRDRQHSKL